jgi:hypothetical protein
MKSIDMYVAVLKNLEMEGLGTIVSFEKHLAFVTPTFSDYCSALFYLTDIGLDAAEYFAEYGQYREGKTGFMVYWPKLDYLGE